jgi:hypothetical protein
MTELAADPGRRLLALTAELGSASRDGLRLLGSWAATTQQPTAPATKQPDTRT